MNRLGRCWHATDALISPDELLNPDANVTHTYTMMSMNFLGSSLRAHGQFEHIKARLKMATSELGYLKA